MAFKRTYFYITFLLGLIGLIFLYAHFNPLDYACFPKCPIKQLTGLDCPGCGGQRAAHQLFQGKIREAFAQNQLLFFLAPYIVLGFYLQLVPKPSIIELKLRKFLYGHRAIQVLFIIIITFTIFRNIY